MNFDSTWKYCILSIQLGVECFGEGRSKLPSLPALPLGTGSSIDKENKKEETISLQTRGPRVAFLRAAPIGFAGFLQWVKQALPGQEKNRLQPTENKIKVLN